MGRGRAIAFFFLRLRKNESTRYSVEKAIAAEGQRWVGLLIEEAWRPFLLMRHRSSVSGKTKVCCCNRGEQGATAHCSKVKSSAIHRTFSEGEVAVKLQTPWDKIYQQWVVSWMDNWDNKQFTTNHDKNDKSLNATAMAVLLLRDAPHYWHGHPSLKELERRVSIVAGMLGNTEGTFVRILCDLGLASTRLVVRNIRAPLDNIREVPARRPLWRPVCLSKENVSGNVSLLNLLQFIRDLAQHTRPAVPVRCDENIHYRIRKLCMLKKQLAGTFAFFCGPTLYYTASGMPTNFVLHKRFA